MVKKKVKVKDTYQSLTWMNGVKTTLPFHVRYVGKISGRSCACEDQVLSGQKSEQMMLSHSYLVLHQQCPNTLPFLSTEYSGSRLVALEKSYKCSPCPSYVADVSPQTSPEPKPACLDPKCEFDTKERRRLMLKIK